MSLQKKLVLLLPVFLILCSSNGIWASHFSRQGIKSKNRIKQERRKQALLEKKRKKRSRNACNSGKIKQEKKKNSSNNYAKKRTPKKY